jgi:aminoglycoside phosphotransferase (APT) family kinase protein
MTETIAPNERFNISVHAATVSEIEGELIGGYFYPDHIVEEAQLLKGGYSNANFLLTTETHPKYPSETMVRVNSFGPETARREISILEIARKAGVKVPQVYSFIEDAGGRAAIHMEFVKGTLLSDLLLSADKNSDLIDAALKSAGEQLAKIHGISFDEAGLFSESGLIEHVFTDFPGESKSFIVNPLLAKAGERMGSHAQEVLSLIDEHWKEVHDSYQLYTDLSGPRLIHCDFNPKNIIVSDDGKVTILDWEYSMSGHPLVDFGNFFRFIEDYPEGANKIFVDAYRAAGGLLPNDWERSARLSDLVSMCSFLNQEEEYTATFTTAKLVIRRSLKWFSDNSK